MTDAADLDPALVAQPRATRALTRLLEEQRAHALLCSGAPNSGPIAAARLVARRVLCPGGGDDGCATCGRVDRRVHPDLMWLRPEGNTYSVDQARSIVGTVTQKPFEGVAQVVVIEEAETLSTNRFAANSLLKVIEEPEGRVVFVLLARSTARILPTIRSRCVEVAFPPVPDALLVDALRADGVDEGTLAAATGLDLASLARIARGDLQRAREIAAGDAAAQRRGDVLTTMYQVAKGDAAPTRLAEQILARAGAAGEAAAAAAGAEFDELELTMSDRERKTFNGKTNPDGREKRTARRSRAARLAELQACLAELAGWWRDVLAVATGGELAVSNVDRIEQLRVAAASPAATRAVPALDAIDDAALRLRVNNADEPVTVGALASELAALSRGRIRARRMLGGGTISPEGYELVLA